MARTNGNGLLPVNGNTVCNGSTAPDTSKSKSVRSPPTGKKITIRRLPPGLSEDEFWTILGDEWKVGNEKVNWACFEVGKVSKHPGKPSRPAYCTLHVAQEYDLPAICDIVSTACWEDGKETFGDPAIVGPPEVLTSLFQKVPVGKRRTDARLGTIDQDPEFMQFLASLTDDAQHTPPKDSDMDKSLEDSAKDMPKVPVSLLVAHLRERKAAKEAGTAKAGKPTQKESSQPGKAKVADDARKRGKDAKMDKIDREKETDKSWEPVRVLIKKAAACQDVPAIAKSVASPSNAKADMTSTQAGISDKARRAGIAAAAKVLQRDLGLSPGSAHRRARINAFKADEGGKNSTAIVGRKFKDARDADSKDNIKETARPKSVTEAKSPVPNASSSAQNTPIATKTETLRRTRGKGGKRNTDDAAATSAPSKPTVGPMLLLKKDAGKVEDPSAATLLKAGSTTSAATALAAAPTGVPSAVPPIGPRGIAKVAPKQIKAISKPTAGATQAFLKHANPSQGVTESLLKQAMEAFGPVTYVEIDRRKGFAHVDFADEDGLCKAMAASPVSVGQGAVQVLEKRERKEKEAKKPAASASSKKASDAVNEPSCHAERTRGSRGGRVRNRRGQGGSAAGGPAEGVASTVSDGP